MVAAVAAWPVWAKVTAKSVAAFPFFFHALNGIRHLTWDVGLGFKNKTVVQTGWTAVGLTMVCSAYYIFFG